MNALAKEKQLAAKEAVRWIENNQIVGLGTGSSAFFAIQEIGEMVKNGLRIQAIPTSIQTKELAESLHIPLIDINSVSAIDITIDGADEFTDDLTLIKGGGGALLREKIVASLTKKQIIIADSTKKVDLLGQFKLPIEVIPFAANYVLSQLKRLQGKGEIRMKENAPYLTDQGNYIIDSDFGFIQQPHILAEKIKQIVGIVEHGLFINLTHMVIMGNGDECLTFS